MSLCIPSFVRYNEKSVFNVRDREFWRNCRSLRSLKYECQFRFRVQDPYAPVGGGEATANNSPLSTAATAQAGESREQYKLLLKININCLFAP